MHYVMSDIHGHSKRFESILKQINLQENDTLYILGDVIDRNPDGVRLLRRIMKMPNVKMVLGNHEHMMLKALYYPIELWSKWHDEKAIRQDNLNTWYRNGGEVTHYYLKHNRKEVRQEIFEYLDKLPVNIEVEVNGKSFILGHAGIWHEEISNRRSNYTVEDAAIKNLTASGLVKKINRKRVNGSHTSNLYVVNNLLEIAEKPP